LGLWGIFVSSVQPSEVQNMDKTIHPNPSKKTTSSQKNTKIAAGPNSLPLNDIIGG
jgi:hypothetical protein